MERLCLIELENKSTHIDIGFIGLCFCKLLTKLNWIQNKTFYNIVVFKILLNFCVSYAMEMTDLMDYLSDR